MTKLLLNSTTVTSFLIFTQLVGVVYVLVYFIYLFRCYISQKVVLVTTNIIYINGKLCVYIVITYYEIYGPYYVY